MAAQRFTTSEVRQIVCDSGKGNVDSDIEIEVIIYGTFYGCVPVWKKTNEPVFRFGLRTGFSAFEKPVFASYRFKF